MKKIIIFTALLIALTISAGAFEVTLMGGARMDIPAAWELDDSDSSVPTWYSPDRKGAAEVVLWEPGTWELLETFVDSVKPDGAVGDIVAFSCWRGEVALADWTFPVAGERFRGWFLIVRGSGPDVRVSAISAEEDFLERQPFLLSILIRYVGYKIWVSWRTNRRKLIKFFIKNHFEIYILEFIRFFLHQVLYTRNIECPVISGFLIFLFADLAFLGAEPFAVGRSFVSGEEGPFDRIFFGIEHDEVKVPDDDGRAGEDGFVVVDGDADIEKPFREVGEGPLFVGQEPASEHHHDGTPDERPVLGFFDVAVVLETGTFLA